MRDVTKTTQSTQTTTTMCFQIKGWLNGKKKFKLSISFNTCDVFIQISLGWAPSDGSIPKGEGRQPMAEVQKPEHKWFCSKVWGEKIQKLSRCISVLHTYILNMWGYKYQIKSCANNYSGIILPVKTQNYAYAIWKFL